MSEEKKQIELSHGEKIVIETKSDEDGWLFFLVHDHHGHIRIVNSIAIGKQIFTLSPERHDNFPRVRKDRVMHVVLSDGTTVVASEFRAASAKSRYLVDDDLSSRDK